MKKIVYLFILSASLAVFYSSCKKGDTGPQGATGAQGLIGPAGPTGANGQNGSMIYAGSSLPATTTGINGDYYLDTEPVCYTALKQMQAGAPVFRLKALPELRVRPGQQVPRVQPALRVLPAVKY